MKTLQTKFEQQYVRCVRNEEECVCSVCLFRSNIFIGVRIIKEMEGSVASGTPCITLVDLQLDAQNSYLFTYNTIIKTLYMFRTLPCSSSGGLRRNCIYAASGIVTVLKWHDASRPGRLNRHAI